MPYGTIKVDQVIYTKGGSDTTITVSGIVDSLSGAISVTGAISGASVSAATGTFTTLSGNTTAGTTATFTSGVFTTFSGTTVNVVSGVFASGTVAAPSVSVGTSGNGLYSPGANQLAISTSGTGRLTVDNSGNVNIDSGTFYVDAVNNRVGIGITGPGYLLDVVGTGSQTAAIRTATSGDPKLYLEAGGTNAGFVQYSRSSQALQLSGQNPTVHATVDNSGNVNIDSGTFYVDAVNNRVGVGTTGPSYAFDVANSVIQVGNSTDAFVQYKSTAGNWHVGVTGGGAYNFYTGTYGTGAFRMSLDASGNLGLGVVPSAWSGLTAAQVANASIRGSSGVAGFGHNNYYDGTNFRYQLATFASDYYQINGTHVWRTAPSWNGSGSNAITFTQAMTLDASGNLGIGPGATSPQARFHVSGTGAAAYVGQILQNTSSTGYVQQIFHVGSAGANGEATISYAPGTFFAIGPTANDTTTPITFRNNNAQERARIDSSGRLLVGTTTDSGGALLQVNGDRIRVATAKTPASATATGTAGEVCWDANYIYVCTATNTWKRAAIATW